jgi:hypothetical protein
LPTCFFLRNNASNYTFVPAGRLIGKDNHTKTRVPAERFVLARCGDTVLPKPAPGSPTFFNATMFFVISFHLSFAAALRIPIFAPIKTPLTMKRIILFAAIALLSFSAQAQEQKSEPSKQFMQITTIESVVSGGLGRSKMIVTEADGSQKELDMENLFSLTGINFKNIKDNESKVVQTIKRYTDDGWKIDQTSSFALSPSQNSSGIFMTRYLLSKPEVKKGF